MARLIVKNGDDVQTFELALGEAMKVGRDASNEIALPDEGKASRRHCQIIGVRSGGAVAYEVTDLGATNKTRVNNKTIDRKVLTHGDVIQVGTVEITFEDPEEEERLRAAGSQGICYLEWVNKERKGEKVLLEPSRVTIGRRDSSTIKLEDDRMASGHHAEVTRDLNGYTVRDLGSTNGTLVNGEPITEAPLSHGTRIRVGNSRFVFKDPSMKDIEVELSQFDEDEGWGMMGDIDLTRARGGYGGLLVGLLLLGAIAGGAFLFMQGADTGDAEVADTQVENLIDDGTFEEADVSWDTDEDGPVSARAKSGKLQVKHTATGDDDKPNAPGAATYDERLAGLAGKSLNVSASVRREGDGELVAIWHNKADKGVTQVTHTMRLGAPGSRGVDVRLAKPSWADEAELAVRVADEGRVTLDDVVVSYVDEERGPVSLDAPGDVSAAIDPAGGSVDLINNLTVLMLGAQPVARTSDGELVDRFVAEEVTDGGVVRGALYHGETKLPATVTWSKDVDGVRAVVDVSGAAASGLRFGLPRAHLADGVNLLSTEGPRTVSAAAGAALAGVYKFLAGEPKAVGERPVTLVTVESPQPGAEGGPSAEGSFEVRLRDGDDATLLDAVCLVDGAGGVLRFITDYAKQNQLARERLTEGTRLLRTDPGTGIRALKAVAQEFPFNEQVRDAATKQAADRERKAWEDIEKLEAALKDFRIFQSPEALAAVESQAATLGQDFAAQGAAGPLEQRVGELVAESTEARRDFNARGAGADLARLEGLANLLREEEGYEPMAAMFLKILVERYGDLRSDPALGPRVAKAAEDLAALLKAHADDIPPPPADPQNPN